MKRFFDIVGATIGLALLSPVIAAIAFLIWRQMGAPIFFRQTRPGLNGNPFEMVKFRTMRDAIDEQGLPLADLDRLTPLGKFLRASSLDEVPELWNVLKGEMSLVGPRPLAMIYLPLYSAEQFRRHEVKPGITGWAQINGRNSVTWRERFMLDVWYVDNWTIGLDIKILFITVKKVFLREDVRVEGQSSIESFNGHN